MSHYIVNSVWCKNTGDHSTEDKTGPSLPYTVRVSFREEGLAKWWGESRVGCSYGALLGSVSGRGNDLFQSAMKIATPGCCLGGQGPLPGQSQVPWDLFLGNVVTRGLSH